MQVKGWYKTTNVTINMGVTNWTCNEIFRLKHAIYTDFLCSWTLRAYCSGLRESTLLTALSFHFVSWGIKSEN